VTEFFPAAFADQCSVSSDERITMTLTTFVISLVLIVLGAGLVGHFLGPKLPRGSGSDYGSAAWFARRMKHRFTFNAVTGIYILLVIALVVFIYPLGCALGVPWNVFNLAPQILFNVLMLGGGVLIAGMVVLYFRGKE
jgi:uncharacterized membrane protein YbhN (UPF0104 family)